MAAAPYFSETGAVGIWDLTKFKFDWASAAQLDLGYNVNNRSKTAWAWTHWDWAPWRRPVSIIHRGTK